MPGNRKFLLGVKTDDGNIAAVGLRRDAAAKGNGRFRRNEEEGREEEQQIRIGIFPN